MLNLKKLISEENIELLENLIISPDQLNNNNTTSSKKDEDNQNDKKFTRYKLTLLKRPSHSLKPKKIKESVVDFEMIKNLYQNIEPIIKGLTLNQKSVQYYANWAVKSKISQLTQINNEYKRYLYLICFISHQYHYRQDLLVDIFNSSVQSAKNSSTRTERDEYFKNKKNRQKVLKLINSQNKTLKDLIIKAKSILSSLIFSDKEKIAKTNDLLDLNKFYKTANDNQSIDDENDKIQDLIEKELKSKSEIDEDYYDIIELKSVKLQNKINPILKHLEFNSEYSNKNMMEVINFYQEKEGNIIQSNKLPIDFLTDNQKEIIYKNIQDKPKLRISLYKSLLFFHINDAIKSGELSLKHSYRYLSIEQYLFDKEFWKKNRERLIKEAGLENYENIEKLLEELKTEFHNQYNITNQNIISGQNKYVKLNQKGKPTPITPKLEISDEESQETVRSLFPKNQFYPILQILKDVNNTTNFLDCFEHYSAKHSKIKPRDEIFFSGIMGKGFDIGVNKISGISKGINSNTLSNTTNWYFLTENLHSANNVINQFIQELALPNIYLKNNNQIHTSSDGQKFNMSVESLNSNYSFKYHGKEKGLSVYSLIDNRSRLTYNTAFSSSYREAAFVIDGLIHNDEIKSDIHSTDSHGYTEAIFATTHMMDIFFAPRIKNLKKQKIYSFKEDGTLISDYKNKNYNILSDEYINEDKIKENWDDVLRLIATIKLKKTSASQIFRRLNSYTKQNPIYESLKEFGRIIKSIFTLKYYDDLELRQSIEKQLNLVELSHKFAKVIFFGNNQEFDEESKEEQDIIVNCRRLIQNAIILWNYLYLTNLLINTKDEKQRQEIINIIKNSSIMTWGHINLYGEYDFEETANDNGERFDIEQIKAFKVGA